MSLVRFALCVIALGISVPAGAAEYPEEMEFEEFQPCRGTASFCAPRILARGVIDDGASERLQAFLSKTPFRRTIAFDSPGGSLREGLRLGFVIREGGHDTVVASEYREELPPQDGFTGFRVLAENAGCFSACAYAFMGGVSRTLEDDGRLGVHQFAGAEVAPEATAQVMTSVLSQYVIAMGVGRDILDLAGLTSADDMSVISKAHAVEYNLDNQHPLLAEWKLDAMESGIAVKVEQQQPGSDRITRILLTRSNDYPKVLFVAVGNGTQDEVQFNAADVEGAKSEFCIDYLQCVQAVTIKPWAYSKEHSTISALFVIDSEEFVDLILKKGTFTFDAGFSKALMHLQPDVELGRSGLRNALLALYR